MKIQRKIVALLCCLAFMGTLSFDALSAQAAACSHEIFHSYIDFKGMSYEDDGHYEVSGLTFVCVNCGYQYWDDNSNMTYRKVGNHKFVYYELVESTWESDVFKANCETPECPYQNIKIYVK